MADLAGQYDTDGIDICFLNDKRVAENVRVGPFTTEHSEQPAYLELRQSSADVCELFETMKPVGITPIGDKLEELLHVYLREIEVAHDTGNPANLKAIRPINYVVITDGSPSKSRPGLRIITQ